MAATVPAKEDPPPPPADSKGAEEKGLSTWGMLLAAIGGGIGVLSFVAFFGAAILWVRFQAAHLPASEAVAVVPKSVLITTGAAFLVPSMLVAVAFVAVLYMIETSSVMWSTRTLRTLEAKLAGREEIAEARKEEAVDARRKTEEAAKMVVATQQVEEAASTGPVAGPLSKEAAQVAQNAVANATEMQQEALPAEHEADLELNKVKKEVETERLKGREGIEKRRRSLRWALTIVAFLAGALATVALFSIQIPAGGVFLLLLLLAAICTVCLAILGGTDSFAWFALAVVVAVGILSGFLTYYRTRGALKLEPAAVLRAHGSPVYGFYVAQTSDRIYLGTEQKGDPRKLDSIPREEVLNLMVGSLQPLKIAQAEAREFAMQLCHLARLRKATGKIAGDQGGGKLGKEVAAGCTGKDAKRLKES